MKKVFYYGMTSLMIISFIGFIYVLFTGSSTNPFYLMFLSIISGLMAMMTEKGITKEQENKLFGMLMGVMAIIIVIVMMSSCTTTRYGCPVNATNGFGPGR